MGTTAAPAINPARTEPNTNVVEPKRCIIKRPRITW